jgi:hypothetical protein
VALDLFVPGWLLCSVISPLKAGCMFFISFVIAFAQKVVPVALSIAKAWATIFGPAQAVGLGFGYYPILPLQDIFDPPSKRSFIGNHFMDGKLSNLYRI